MSITEFWKSSPHLCTILKELIHVHVYYKYLITVNSSTTILYTPEVDTHDFLWENIVKNLPDIAPGCHLGRKRLTGFFRQFQESRTTCSRIVSDSPHLRLARKPKSLTRRQSVPIDPVPGTR